MVDVPRRVSNPPNPWQSQHVEWLGEAPEVALEVYEEEARTILSRNDSPDLDFDWSLNPYRGCTHGCAYCYARPTHEYLEWGAGTDFDRKIVAKRNAPELLRKELASPKWTGQTIAFSGVTDCYQPLEARYELTRRCLEVCVEHDNPVGIITKGTLVQRDIDLLTRLSASRVFLSIPFVDDARGVELEPWVARPSQRFRAIRALSDAGISTGIAIAPLIPGLNEHLVAALLEEAAACGATHAFLSMLRLQKSVLPVFVERLEAACPDRAKRVLSSVREVRGGELDDSRFGSRFTGSGPRVDVITQLFNRKCTQLGLNRERVGRDLEQAHRPRKRPGQQTLFEES